MGVSPLAVVVPVPSTFPSGGNVFNARILDGLSQLAELTVHFVDPADMPPAIEPGARVLIDTLLLDGAEAALARAGERGLLVHHLELFDPATRDGERARLERRWLEGYSFFVTTSAWSARALRQLGVRAEIEVVYPGLDDAFRHAALARRAEDGRVRLLTVANLIPRKGLLELARTLESLASLPFAWTVVGSERLDPEYARRFHALCVETGLAGRVRVLEAPPATILSVYDDSDLFLSGARFETLGMALREAMVRALPVLGWNVGGIGESVRHGQSGFLVEPGDEAAFAARLRELIEQPELRRTLGARAREHALVFPTWRAAQARFHAALAGRKAVPAPDTTPRATRRPHARG